MEYDIVWDDSFDIGVEIIDKAHQNLTSIVRKMLTMTHDSDEEKKRKACEEGIKYFKSYAIQHFAEEESYMRSIDYEEYEKHRMLHSVMRDITIPELELDLIEANYSDEAVESFLGVCMGWLTGHIMIEDRKLTQAEPPKKDRRPGEEEIHHLARAMNQTIQDLFSLEARVENERYDGEYFGKAVYYKLTYRNLHGEELYVIFAVEKPLVAKTVGKMLFLTFSKINKTVIAAMQQLSQQIMHSLHTYFAESDDTFSLTEDEMLNAKEFQQEFETGHSQYSLLFETELGYFAFFIHRPE